MPVVNGRVRTRDGDPVPGAVLAFTSGPGALPDVAALADDDGAFSLTAPIAGTYRIAANSDGYRAAECEVEVDEGSVSVELHLEPLD